jgi:hypothetical protein
MAVKSQKANARSYSIAITSLAGCQWHISREGCHVDHVTTMSQRRS